jgi:hypothetical protein
VKRWVFLAVALAGCGPGQAPLGGCEHAPDDAAVNDPSLSFIADDFPEESALAIERAMSDWLSVGASVTVFHFQLMMEDHNDNVWGGHSGGVVAIHPDALHVTYEIALHEIGHNVRGDGGHHEGRGVMRHYLNEIEPCISQDDMVFVGLEGSGTCQVTNR